MERPVAPTGAPATLVHQPKTFRKRWLQGKPDRTRDADEGDSAGADHWTAAVGGDALRQGWGSGEVCRELGGGKRASITGDLDVAGLRSCSAPEPRPGKLAYARYPLLSCQSALERGSPRFLVHPDEIEATRTPYDQQELPLDSVLSCFVVFCH